MTRTTQHSHDALTYARPLLELGLERNQADDIGRDLGAVAEAVRANPSFGLFLADPGIGADEKRATLDRLFKGKAHPLVANFLNLLNNRGRLRLVEGIAAAYDDLLADQRGIVEVDVTTAQKLSPDELEQVKRRVGQALGKQVVVHPYVDEAIIGGIVLRMEDKLLDASVRQQLRTLREQLLARAPR
ncbi:MAG TPA: ATP synthase F1 subunit delta [Tepidisphaeraceae bacterium]|nr:ATP synthase F1 subunit delta [Tepidisphaeraceae bacterium]